MIKLKLHPRNKHRSLYEFQKLIQASPELAPFIMKSISGDQTINFANSSAVKTLNKALLFFHYKLEWWDIPKNYLCPPIPGRADYIHYLADLIGLTKDSNLLDIGTGANCIYPIIGVREYGWNFVGSDIDNIAVQNASKIIANNSILHKKIELRLQPNPNHFFKNIIQQNETFAATLCNPPFHASETEAKTGSDRKYKNLGSGQNFGGQSNELWCEGGEKKFIKKMIQESFDFRNQVEWFTTLVSKKDNLPELIKTIDHFKVNKTKIINMEQGQKITRILAWSWTN